MTKDTLIFLTKGLKKRNLFPKNMELAKIGPVHIATAFDSDETKIMSGSATTGLSTDPYLSSVKALTELIERKAFIEGYNNNLKACVTKNSDGFAAYPTISTDSKELARGNALSEAIERYVWATWWDNYNYSHEVLSLNKVDKDLGFANLSLLKKVDATTSIIETVIVKPKFLGYEDKELIIFFTFLKNGGVTSGGACGERKDSNKTIFRALSELVRHSIALNRAIKENTKPKSFYEQRLLFFGKPQADNANTQIVRDRIFNTQTDKKAIKLPELIFDNEIPHNLKELASVHRCYFKDQPLFVGGDLKRLCL